MPNTGENPYGNFADIMQEFVQRFVPPDKQVELYQAISDRVIPELKQQIDKEKAMSKSTTMALDDLSFVTTPAEGFYVIVNSDLDNIGTMIALTSLHFITNDGMKFRKDITETRVVERSGNLVKFEIVKGGLWSDDDNHSIDESVLKDTSTYACYGWSQYDPRASVAVLGIAYNGSEIRMMVYTEASKIKPKKEQRIIQKEPESKDLYPSTNITKVVFFLSPGPNFSRDAFDTMDYFRVSSSGFDYKCYDIIQARKLEKFTGYYGLTLYINRALSWDDCLVSDGGVLNTILELGEFKGFNSIEYPPKFIVTEIQVSDNRGLMVGTIERRQKELRRRQENDEIDLSYAVKERRSHVDFYQVRRIYADEFSHLDSLEVKKDLGIKGQVQSHHELSLPESSRNICSNLTLKEGCHLDKLVVMKGGYVTVEEGACVGEAYVLPGGTLELCYHCQIEYIYEYGGAVYGDTSNTKFGSVRLMTHIVSRHMTTTLHKGTICQDVEVYGHLDLNQGSTSHGVIAHEGSVSIYGGYHSDMVVEKDVNLNIIDGTIDGLIAKPGSHVAIYGAAVINSAEIGGELKYYGDSDIKDDPRFSGLVLKDSATVSQFNMDDLLDDDEDDIEMGDEE